MPFYANSSIQLNYSLIAYISCDDSKAAALAVAQASNFSPTFILLYATTANSCDFGTSYLQYDDNLGAVFSVLSASAGKQIRSSARNSVGLLDASIVVNTTDIYNALTTTSDPTAPSTLSSYPQTTTVFATETLSSTVINPGFRTWTPATGPAATAGSSADSSSSGSSSSGNKSQTAVAMVVLYSITGLVSGFFLLIIILGAIRAHRHPERYQITTHADGTVQRTNRAKGIAKAVLDSIPLVRIPQRSELNYDNQSSSVSGTDDQAKGNDGNISRSESVTESWKEGEGPGDTDEEAMAAAVQDVPATDDLLPSSMIPLDICPICFDPFLSGQDLRVLPCHHGFHASCVDPWLLNSSSQCPLCRVDLNLRIGDEIPSIPPGLLDVGDEQQPTSSISGATVDEANTESVTSRWNMFLDRWNAQMLPAAERRAALQRVREEREARARIRRLREEHLRSEEGGRTWRRFVEMRRRMFHLQQQQEQQQQQQQEQRQRPEHGSEDREVINETDESNANEHGGM